MFWLPPNSFHSSLIRLCISQMCRVCVFPHIFFFLASFFAHHSRCSVRLESQKGDTSWNFFGNSSFLWFYKTVFLFQTFKWNLIFLNIILIFIKGYKANPGEEIWGFGGQTSTSLENSFKLLRILLKIEIKTLSI